MLSLYKRRVMPGRPEGVMNRGERRGTHMAAWILVCATAILMAGLSEARAGDTLYSYVDERGNLVATDRWEDIPARYHAKVKVAKKAAGQNGSKEWQVPSLGPMPATREGFLYVVIDRLPSTVIPGLSTYQSVILIGGILAMFSFYGAGKLTGSPFFRLLMPWAIGFLAVATFYFMFLSDLSNTVAERYPNKSTGSLIKHFKGKSREISEQKQQRVKEFDRGTGQD